MILAHQWQSLVILVYSQGKRDRLETSAGLWTYWWLGFEMLVLCMELIQLNQSTKSSCQYTTIIWCMINHSQEICNKDYPLDESEGMQIRGIWAQKWKNSVFHPAQLDSYIFYIMFFSLPFPLGFPLSLGIKVRFLLTFVWRRRLGSNAYRFNKEADKVCLDSKSK